MFLLESTVRAALGRHFPGISSSVRCAFSCGRSLACRTRPLHYSAGSSLITKERTTVRPSARTATKHDPYRSRFHSSAPTTANPPRLTRILPPPDQSLTQSSFRDPALVRLLFPLFSSSASFLSLRWSVRARKCVWRAMDASWKAAAAAALRTRCARCRAA